MIVRTLPAVSASLAMLVGCAGAPDEEVGAGEGASTVDVSVTRLAEALVGKSMVTTSDVVFEEANGSWTASVTFTLPTSAGITASSGKGAGNLYCTLLTTDKGEDLLSRSIPKGATHTIASVKLDARVVHSYDLTFTDPDTRTTSNFTGFCATNLPFASNATLL